MMALLRNLSGTLGLKAFLAAPRDTHLLCAQRFTRFAAFATTSLVMVLYMSALGFEDAAIGFFMTLTLWGDVLLSFVLTAFGDRLGRRRVLMAGSLGMIGSGVVFALCSSYWALLLAAIIGVISPAVADVGPFRAIEESTLAQLTAIEVRSDIFAWYSLMSSLGSAIGQLFSGFTTSFLQTHRNMDPVASYRFMFWAYALFGTIKFILTVLLSEKCEAAPAAQRPLRNTETPTETQPLLSDIEDQSADTTRPEPSDNSRNQNDAENATHQASPVEPPSKARRTSCCDRARSGISPESRMVTAKLAMLFAVDSFGSSLVGLSWISYWFAQTYSIKEDALGQLFFVGQICSAVSVLLAVPIARRFGPVNTMVFTHLPSCIFLALVPVFPSTKLSMLFITLRFCTSSMDVAPRQAFLAAVVLPSERTAVMGTINVIKTASQSAGPTFTGMLAGLGHLSYIFVIAGALKGGYDLAMLTMFSGHKPREEQTNAVSASDARSQAS